MLVWLHRIQLLKNKNWHEKSRSKAAGKTLAWSKGYLRFFNLLACIIQFTSMIILE